MIAFDGVLLVDRHPRPDQPDIADVVLRAGMVAAGEMDVEQGLDVLTSVRTSRRSRQRCSLVFDAAAAAGVAGAGDQPGADLRGFNRKTNRLDRCYRQLDIFVTHA